MNNYKYQDCILFLRIFASENGIHNIGFFHIWINKHP
ncbi:MAG: hypothetical protein BWY95_01635 [Bacteroidetes bacterium ADurb.BinA104]|jgi:hypothetical protein|nr:MAG: hypothetical protein BWY95_01635 [Bacteroidetes bacterium ADurb.BinA104]